MPDPSTERLDAPMRAALASAVNEAFAGEVLADGAAISVDTFDDEGAQQQFGGTHWRDHAYADLEGRLPCLTFFTPQAFCAFLPAYLMAAIDHPGSWFAGELAERLSPPKNDPSRTSYQRWWSLLGHDQRGAVAAFLRWMQADHGAIPEVDVNRLETHRAT